MTPLEALRRCYARGARLRITDAGVEGAGAETDALAADVAYTARAIPVLESARERVGEGAMRDALKAMDEGDFRSWINAWAKGDLPAAATCIYWFAEGCPLPKSKRALNR